MLVKFSIKHAPIEFSLQVVLDVLGSFKKRQFMKIKATKELF